jgi:hypothetical protein
MENPLENKKENERIPIVEPKPISKPRYFPLPFSPLFFPIIEIEFFSEES